MLTSPPSISASELFFLLAIRSFTEHLLGVSTMLPTGDSVVNGTWSLSRSGSEPVGNRMTHVGVDFKIKTVELRGKKIRLQIWDTAGQERFNSITSAYYRSAKGIILVYDITKKETFDDLPKWMKMIDKYASEDAELLLVGNKLDCETDREITRQQGEKFAQQITGMRFCEASAKDNFNVDEIFLKLVDDILKKMPLDILRNELSNSILSLQPEPEIPPELPPPRPHVRCC
uniref:ras-related protein Rab-12 isoform X2 n=1 Tax=Odobenus rosmarus divergens TaxID=9708 RepID=UPI00063CF5BF|nr:PREDICTED: ras-related protein Rab-12 isoform X2 [Odobenus rosmarus divergens]